MRNSHTIAGKINKAKCLAFHNGKRCGRVAKHEVTFNATWTRGAVAHLSVCPRCLEELQADERVTNLNIRQSSPKGLVVKPANFSGSHRAYVAIQ